MKFNGLTNKGREYLAKVQANQSAITFKKIVIGDGRLDEHDNPAELTRLINKKAEKGIISKEQNADIVTLLTYVDNVSLSQGYYPREIGVYIDDGGEEKLYYYMNDGDETSWIPPESYGPFKIELKLNIIASNADSIVVNNPAKSMYVTKEYVDTELAKKENAFDKNSGFNLNKTDSYEEDDTNKLATARALKRLYDWIRNKLATLTLSWDKITNKPNLTTTENLTQLLKGKENTFAKNTAFNKNFGTTSGTVMEGDKYEVIKSIPGTTSNIKIIQDSIVKNKGDFCIDKHTGRICKCIQQTSTTTNDSNYFQDVTLDKLSDRLDNLITITTKGTQLPSISRINDLKICFIQSSSSVPVGYHEDTYRAEDGYKIIPLSVTWKDNIHRNDYLAFDYEVTNSTITVAYNATTTSMSYLLVYLLVR